MIQFLSMKITQIEKQKNNPGRYNVFLDGEFTFGADEDLIVDRRLLKGKEINSEELEILIKESEIGKLMERMYGLLSRRARSEGEIRIYLKQLSFKRKLKGDLEISEIVAAQLIEKLKKKGLINDLEFARSWIESRSKKKGKVALKSELFQKGIDREIIEEAISSQSSAISEAQTAQKLLEKRIERWKNLSKPEIKQKSLQFLISRGFDYEASKEVVENFLKEDYT